MSNIDKVKEYLNSEGKISAIIVYSDFQDSKFAKKQFMSYLKDEGYFIFDSDCLYSVRFKKDGLSSVVKFITKETYSDDYKNLKINFYVAHCEISNFMKKILDRNTIGE